MAQDYQPSLPPNFWGVPASAPRIWSNRFRLPEEVLEEATEAMATAIGRLLTGEAPVPVEIGKEISWKRMPPFTVLLIDQETQYTARYRSKAGREATEDLEIDAKTLLLRGMHDGRGTIAPYSNDTQLMGQHKAYKRYTNFMIVTPVNRLISCGLDLERALLEDEAPDVTLMPTTAFTLPMTVGVTYGWKATDKHPVLTRVREAHILRA